MMRRVLGVGLIAALLGAASPASAAAETEVVTGQYLRMVSTLDRQAAVQLAPGDTIDWFIDLSVLTDDPGEVAISVEGHGELDLTAEVDACAGGWDADTCSTGAQRIRTDWAVPSAGRISEMVTFDAVDTLHLRLALTVPDVLAEVARLDLRVIAEGFGEEAEAGLRPDEGSELPATGGDTPWIVVLAASLSIVMGVALARGARSRMRRRRRREGTP